MDQISARSRKATVEGENSKGIDRPGLVAQLRWDMAVHDILSALKTKQVAGGVRRQAATTAVALPEAQPSLVRKATRAFFAATRMSGGSPRQDATRLGLATRMFSHTPEGHGSMAKTVALIATELATNSPRRFYAQCHDGAQSRAAAVRAGSSALETLCNLFEVPPNVVHPPGTVTSARTLKRWQHSPRHALSSWCLAHRYRWGGTALSPPPWCTP